MISRNHLHHWMMRECSWKDSLGEYNHIHRHSGIAWHTPASVNFGTADAVDEARQITLNEAYVANPERVSRRPSPPEVPTVFFINEPAAESQIN
ncbi:hypothetical protein [Rhodococcus sp. ARC_M6]|uniref:hypothetical protein n=1 Tax=Rhodococcus sp. ARC_M6 TaxID=2928852 RepID=UPI001FB21F69|nr:hypothetical protein [Rhodococcus sp. ARC_M6]MCJ0907088.1 hypothetical protein [Rhodococcus sp. ARC_M6]